VEPSEIERARKTLPNAKVQYQMAEQEFRGQLENIIKIHQRWSENLPTQEKMKIPTNSHTINRHRIRLFLAMLRHEGPRKTFRVVKEFGYLHFK
jgi:hypothetical protein